MATVYFLVGFPKCATSSTWQYFDQLSGIEAIADPVSGSLEVSISSLPYVSDRNTVFLKNSSLLYSAKSLSQAVQWSAAFERRVFIIQFSDPLSRLCSWYLFHKEIASSGRAPDHFAYKQREKYLNLTLDNYARERAYLVDYADFMQKSIPLLDGESVWVVNAQDLKSNYELYNDQVCRDFGSSVVPMTINRNITMISEIPKMDDSCLLSQLNTYKRDLHSFLSDPPSGWKILSQSIS